MSIHRLFQCGLKSPKYSNHRQKAIPYIAVFQSLRSLRTATPSGPTPPGTAAYFNPRSPCGLRRPLVWPRPGPPPVFQSSRSLRTATMCSLSTRPTERSFQSSRSLRTATILGVSIPQYSPISILAVLADRDIEVNLARLRPKIFQSSRSLRTATSDAFIPGNGGRDFNPRGPCGPRPYGTAIATPPGNFNPRGPCGPRPSSPRIRAAGLPLFQSSRSLRTATARACILMALSPVFQSSRSLRTATVQKYLSTQYISNFNPRGPCGPRHQQTEQTRKPKEFQSSRSLRTATRDGARPGRARRISILAVLADRDASFSVGSHSFTISILAVLADRDHKRCGEHGHHHRYFNPRGPCGPRHLALPVLPNQS